MKKAGLCVLVLLGLILFSACSSSKRGIEKAKLDMTGIRIGLSNYAMNDGNYPTTEQGLRALVTKPTSSPVPAEWNGPYLKKVSLIDPWGNKYVYRFPSVDTTGRSRYDLFSFGPDGKKSSDDISGRIGKWKAPLK